LKKFHYLFLFLIIVFGSLIYSNSFQSEFQYDDKWLIVDNQGLRDFDEIKSISNWMNIHYRMLSRLSFAANYQINNLDYRSYHLVNLIIHLFTGILIYLFTLQLLAVKIWPERVSDRHIIAFFTALIFVAHPIQTQAITYISQRMTSMAALFYIIAVYFYLRARILDFKNRTVAKSWILILFAMLFGIMSVYVKQTVITFPLVFILIELIFIRNNKGKINIKIVGVIAALVFAGVILILLGDIDTRDSHSLISRSDYFLTQLRVIPLYFQIIIFPYGQNIDHHFIVSGSFGLAETFGLVFNLTIVGAGIFLYLRKYFALSFSIFWIYLTLFIESSIFPIKDVIAEHRMYLPMFGIGLFISHSVFLLLGKKKLAIAIFILAALTISFGVLTYQRNKVWKTPLTLWADAVSKSPIKARPNNNLGHAYLSIGNTDSAIHYLQRAIELKPNYVEALNNLGTALFNNGEYEEAIHFFHKALSYKSDYELAINNIGLAWIKLGEYKVAVDYIEKALKIDPRNPNILYNLGAAFEETEKLEIAKDYYLQALTINPFMAKSTYNLGNVYHKKGNMTEAIHYYEKTLKITPSHADALNNLGNMWNLAGEKEKATAYYKKAITVNPTHLKAQENLRKILSENL